MVTDTIMPPVHPGEILLTEFLEPLGVSQYQHRTAEADRFAGRHGIGRHHGDLCS
ncbi:MAG: helix-turn-helix transcriptional regulator [Streptosporangiaceae bacterium]